MAPFPPASSRGGILSLRGRERIPSVPVTSQEEVLSTGKAKGTPGSGPIPGEKNKIINYKNIILLSYNQANDTKFQLEEVMIVKNYNFDIGNKIDYNLKAKEMDFALVGMQILIFVAIIVKR